MLKMKRDGNIVLGFTTENMAELFDGKVLHLNGEELELPGMQLLLVFGDTHEKMRRELLRAGYNVELLVGPEGEGEHGHHGGNGDRHVTGDEDGEH